MRAIVLLGELESATPVPPPHRVRRAILRPIVTTFVSEQVQTGLHSRTARQAREIGNVNCDGVLAKVCGHGLHVRKGAVQS